MNTKVLLELEWPYLLGCLPTSIELEKTARQYGAIKRRRAVESASILLRLILAYGFCGLSLRQTAAWAEAAEVASVSNVALLKRIRSAADWMGYLVAAKLADTAPFPAQAVNEYNIRLVDATTIRAPGSKGTDFRLHLSFNLARQVIDQAEVTTKRGGETLRRFTFSPSDLVVADCGYARSPGLYAVVKAGADFLVKHNWQSLPLLKSNGKPLALERIVRQAPDAQGCSFPVLVRAATNKSTPDFPAHLVVLRKSEEAAQQARSKVLRRRSRQGCKLDPRALEFAGYTCLITSLDPTIVGIASVLDLYRFRWQIEIAFKRLKGLLSLGQVPSSDPQLAKTVICAKLLAALIVSDYTGRYLDFFPWGFAYRPPSPLAVAD
jgi:hypothetical protein